jgi:hypothetical protein
MSAEDWKDAACGSTTPIDDKKRIEVCLPGKKSEDFIVDAKCKIMKTKSTIQMKAMDLPDDPGGSYSWKTSSSHIKLINEKSANLTVESLDKPSKARDAEEIIVTRTAKDGSTKTKTVKVTVAQVVFSEAKTQRYGFDDFDTPAKFTDDHVCVKKNDHTFVKVTIKGGALGTDFDFVCDDTAACTPVAPGGDAVFDLKLDAGSSNTIETTLRAKVKCPAAIEFAMIKVNVYNEKVVKVLIAKIADSTSAGTTLGFATADFASHQTKANDKLKQAVVKYELENFDAANAVTNVAYDLDKNGVLSFDINGKGGSEFNLIKAAFTEKPGFTRVAIVKDMKSFYYLDKAAKAGDTTVTVRGKSVFTFDRPMPLGSGATQEMIEVVSESGNVGTLKNPLTKDHAAGEAFEFPAAGWSSNPIIIIEGSASLDVAKWTVLHEVGHTALGFDDVIDNTNFMHFDQSCVDYRLRYCPRIKKYHPGEVENQWEKIPRL